MKLHPYDQFDADVWAWLHNEAVAAALTVGLCVGAGAVILHRLVVALADARALR